MNEKVGEEVKVEDGTEGAPAHATPLVCLRCGFTRVGHEGKIPGACEVYEVE